MAKVLIIGGSGRTGLHLLEQVAQRGHTVRALVRKPEAVKAPARRRAGEGHAGEARGPA